MKIIDTLEAQHREVMDAVRALAVGSTDPMVATFELARSLLAHVVVEQFLLYPILFRSRPELVEESFEDHTAMRFLVERMCRKAQHSANVRDEARELLESLEAHTTDETELLFQRMDQGLSVHTSRQTSVHVEQAYRNARTLDLDALVRMSRRVFPPPLVEPSEVL